MAKSILQKERVCFFCGSRIGLEEHHVFGGTANRTLSEQYGLKVYLCPAHHLTGPDAVHRNARIMDAVRKDGQEAFERSYPELDFRKVFGKSYL